MDSIIFFNSDEAELPKSHNSGDFITFLEAIYKDYLQLFSTLKTTDYVTRQILLNKSIVSNLCDNILAAVKNYERGLPHLAFQDIDSGIKSVQVYFDKLCTPVNVAQTNALGELYRIRTEDNFGANFQRPDLFHIPFQLRHKVTRQRYSLPGLPCLYLGGSLYVSWEELGRPNFDTIYYARFKPQDEANITFLDFGYRPALMAAMIDAKQNLCVNQSDIADFAVAQAVCWPLLAASSIKRRFADEPFIAEYIVPQLILQWIINSEKHDGIRYFTVQVDTYMDNPTMLCNYVFPVKKINAIGHCPILREKFQMSAPLSWQYVERMDMPSILTNCTPVHGNSKVEFISGHSLPYIKTPFGKVEARSVGYPCASF